MGHGKQAQNAERRTGSRVVGTELRPRQVAADGCRGKQEKQPRCSTRRDHYGNASVSAMLNILPCGFTYVFVCPVCVSVTAISNCTFESDP